MKSKKTTPDQLLQRYHHLCGYVIAIFAAVVVFSSAISELLHIDLVSIVFERSIVIAVLAAPIFRLGIECFHYWRSGSLRLATISLLTIALVLTTVVYGVL